jgi:L,D-transpeptidase catalytic domain
MSNFLSSFPTRFMRVKQTMPKARQGLTLARLRLAFWLFLVYRMLMKSLGSIDRRGFLAGSLGSLCVAATGGLAHARLPDAGLIDIAKRELARAGRKVWLSDSVGIADFSVPSYEPRFFIIDLVSGKVRPFYVSHGAGSDPEHDGWLKRFSNEEGSLATSRGAYVTHTWYEGVHGTSMRLTGLDADNSNAEDRAIVVHGAAYANPEMIPIWGKLGRSSGCFALPEANLMEVLARLGPGRLLFADKVATGELKPQDL